MEAQQRDVWEKLKSNFIGIIGILVTTAIFFVLFEAVDARTISIAPLLVPQELEHGGMTSVVAVQRLRDALRKFGERANAAVNGPQLAAYHDLPSVTVGQSLHEDLPEFVVPAVGLSVNGIAVYIRTYFGFSGWSNISGEITLFERQLRLHLRLNGRAFYDSPNGVEPSDADRLFADAAKRVFEVTEPYFSAAALADKDPFRAIEFAKQIIADYCLAATVSCQEPRPAAHQGPRQTARWHNLIGSIYHSRYNLTEAKNEYHEAIKADRRFAIAHSNLAGLLREEGDIDGAVTEYREAIKWDPHFAFSYFNLAGALRAQNRQSEISSAERTRRQTRAPRAQSAESEISRRNRALEAQNREREAQAQTERAMTEYRNAIASNPSSVNAHLDFGNALLAEGRSETNRPPRGPKYEEAIYQFDWAASLDSRNGVAQNLLGSALYRLSESLPEKQKSHKEKLRQKAIEAMEKAIEAMKQGVEFSPNLGDAFYNLNLGDAFYNLGVIRRRVGGGLAEKADKDFQDAKGQYEQIAPDHARAHRELGRLLHNEGKLDEAIREFNEAIRIEQHYTEAYRARGLAWFYKGEFGKAVPDFLEVVKTRRDDYTYWVIWLYLAQQKSGDANALSDFKQRAEHVSKIWPYPIIEMFVHDKSTDDAAAMKKTLTAAGEDADYKCEAYFYIGEWLLLRTRDRRAAQGYLKTASEKCRHEFIEYLGAEAELKRLSQGQNAASAASP